MSQNDSHHQHHEHLIAEITEMFKGVLEKSPQAIYIYLDDTHKICNQKFADLVGYKSVQAWVDNQYPISDVEEKDQDKAIKAYMDASRNLKASFITVSVVKKDGKKIQAEVIMTPVTYRDEVFVIHFISEK